MTKCDFCVNSNYSNGKVYCNFHTEMACKNAIMVMSEVLKEQYHSQNTKNINKNYKYERNK